MSNPHLKAVPLEKSYRLLNHGPTVLVSAQDQENTDVMAAAWACALEFQPAKVTVVLDKSTKTRKIIENSGYFALQVPTLKQLNMVQAVGTISMHDQPDKLEQCGVELFQFDQSDIPVVSGCAAWLLCELIPEPHNQQTHDLFIGKVITAYADERVFRDGHWYYQDVEREWRSIHHIAEGHFYSIGDPVSADDID
ncbi:flavin reductase [Acinetobacter schindleri]|jgi:flavin reductase (DIM6/NTAB) family NADH-FMN oxidoreductase RutF|uniref:flavin reductase family protein n=1 Tax=Acinetobacter TaxID=469 RepID=UPI000662970A|nr:MULTISPECIES: flavin reductase family protein [Acinetobacter]KMU99345.1 flavin reductase [Acinetobacter sp. VT 511]PUR00975.1 flavin reductase [Acinetobacter schindleri]